MVSLKNPIKTY